MFYKTHSRKALSHVAHASREMKRASLVFRRSFDELNDRAMNDPNATSDERCALMSRAFIAEAMCHMLDGWATGLKNSVDSGEFPAWYEHALALAANEAVNALGPYWNLDAAEARNHIVAAIDRLNYASVIAEADIVF
jgi:hypothetical protein